MNSHPSTPSDADLDRLLRDCGARLIYPPTPDVVDAVLRRMDGLPGAMRFRQPGESPSGLRNEPFAALDRSGQWDASAPPVDLPIPRRSLRQYAGQALKLAATILAFAAVTVLLVLVFRGFGDDNSRPAVAPPTETTTVTQERLYVVSDVRVTAYDAATGEQLYAIEAGSQIEAVLSLDGSRLFVVDISGGGDSLIALDAATGRELWRTTIQGRVHWIMGLGPSTLAVSPDNQRLYVYSSDSSGTTGDASAIPYRIQVFDANNGDLITDIDTTNCPAALHASPDGRTLYMICHERIGSSSAIDLETGDPTAGIELPLAASGTAVSPNGRLLYIVSGGRATVVDMDERAVVEVVPLELDTYPARLLRLVSLSPDGSRLFVGLGTDVDPDSAAVSSREIAVFDTATWQETGRITTEMPVTGQTLAGAPGNQAVFAVQNAFREGTSIPTTASIFILSPDAEPVVFATLEREEVLAIFAGESELSAMDQPDASSTPPVEITLDAKPGWQFEALITSTTTANGDVSLYIEATGQDDQLNLMWFVSTGRCAFEGDERLRFLYPSDVLLRRNPDSSGPGYQTVTLVLERDWLSQPLMVGAFRIGEGDGPIVLCGDVPVDGG